MTDEKWSDPFPLSDATKSPRGSKRLSSVSVPLGTELTDKNKSSPAFVGIRNTAGELVLAVPVSESAHSAPDSIRHSVNMTVTPGTNLRSFITHPPLVLSRKKKPDCN